MEGGELFERIIDDDYQLTEVDCMVFVRQICEGIRFMHHMRVLHLDLKVWGWGLTAETRGALGGSAQDPWAARSVHWGHVPSWQWSNGLCPHSLRTSSALLPLGTW